MTASAFNKQLQLEDEPQQHKHIPRQVSHSSLGSTNTTSSSSTASTTMSSANASPSDRHQLHDLAQKSSEPDHDPATCLSCTRRNVISVFPRFRKVSTRLLNTFSRGLPKKPLAAPGAALSTGGAACPAADPSLLGAIDESGDSLLPRDLPASKVYPTHPARVALCLGLDLERIVEIRVGEEALWAVSDESCLPHGTRRLFAIVFYQQMAIKTVCLVAQSDESFREWLDTLTYLVSNRQTVTTLAHHQRWRLISISRQWWESDTTGDSATDALRFVEACAPGSQGSLSLLDQLSDMNVATTEETLLDVAENMRMDRAQPSIESVYQEVSLTYINLPPILSAQKPSVVENSKDAKGADSNDNIKNHRGNDEDDEDDDEDGGQLTMAAGRSAINFSKPSSLNLHLDLPRSQPYGLTLSVFAHFLRDVQKETISDAKVLQIFRQFTQHSDQEVMSNYEFEAYLLSAYNSIAPSQQSFDDVAKECMDMDMPLNEYYVSTSHNTYLAGDQLVGDSTVEGYVHALLRGCRCIELDCWDGRYEEPVVCHGNTFTTRILFEDVIIAVSRYAFATSPYPVILSFETHCSLSQQARMATILKKHLGEMLVVAPVNGESETYLPSPNQLKYRIILKNKVLDTATAGNMSAATTTAAAAAARPASGHTRPPSMAASKPLVAAAINSGDVSSGKSVSPRASTSQMRRKVAPELSELIVYCKAVHFEGFDEDDPEPVFDQVTSVSESASNQLMRHRPREYVHYNSVQMTRVYPSFSRFTSSNYSPVPHWRYGCQLVALNFQTHDRHMQVYEAMFQRTLGMGYVLKPKYLREQGAGTADVMGGQELAAANAVPQRTTTVHISVLSAHGGFMARRNSRRQSVIGTTLDRRPSFASDSSGSRVHNGNAFGIIMGTGDNASISSPNVLSRPPSGVAMFSTEFQDLLASATAGYNNGDMGMPFDSSASVGYHSSLNAAAMAAAAAAASANQQQYQHSKSSSSNGGGSSVNSRIRVEVEWISDPGLGGSSPSSSSAEDMTALNGVARILHTRGPSMTTSICDTAPNSPSMHPAVGPGGPTAPAIIAFPFFGNSTSNNNATTSSVAATPLLFNGSIAIPPAPTPLPVALTSNMDQPQVISLSKKTKYTTKPGILVGSEVQWRDASMFRIVNDPDLTFVRLSVFDEDNELASTCVSVDSLKEGYRYIELVENEKSRSCRPVQLMVNVQISQLHCLANPSRV
ncbi:hypothetical protein GGI07_003174 [Coemansia sp. Benny D115]|nr:hypothetical protein GGI07_003174 [Coemansia sp. Benny D115]